MAMNRRNVLIGLGTVAAGGGAVLGTGAFSQVEAQRTVTVNTDGDASALIGLAEGDTSTGVVQVTNGTLEINFDNVSSESGSDSGINLDAKTIVGDVNNSSVDTSAFKITNNSDSTVNITFTISMDSNQDLSGPASDHLNLYTDTSDDANSNIGGADSDFGDLTTETLTLDTGATASVSIEVDLTSEDTSTGVSTSDPLFTSPATLTANTI